MGRLAGSAWVQALAADLAWGSASVQASATDLAWELAPEPAAPPGVAVPDWSTVNLRPAMSIVAERAPPAFGCDHSSTVRLPDPVAIDGLTQDTGLDTFHAQPAMAVIATCTRPPSAAICAEDRSRSKRQLVASWFTVTRAPLRTIAPERATGASLAATVTVTWASPWPASGLSATQVASVVAFQEHSRAADTVACTLVPVAGTDGGSPLRFVAHFTGLGPSLW